MKHKLQALWVAALGAMLALPASASSVANRVFIEDAAALYGAVNSGWSLSAGADSNSVSYAGGTLSFDLDEDDTLTYTPSSPSRADKAATVDVSGARFTLAYEPPASLPEGSQASIVAGCWEGTTNYYGWAGAKADGTNVWTKLGGTPDPDADANASLVFDYASTTTKTVTFLIGGVSIGSLPLTDQSKTQVTDVNFSGTGAISDLDGSYEVNVYTVTFKDGETVVDSVDVDEGETVAAADIPDAPVKTGYNFDAWQSNGSDHDFSAAVTQDFFVTAKYDPIPYTISWDTDGDGTVDDTTTVAYGTVPTHADGAKAADAEYTYTFTGWDIDPVAVTGVATYTAQFDQTPIVPPAVEGVTLALKGSVYLDATSVTNPAVVKFVATTNGVAADVTPTVTATANGTAVTAAVSGDTVTFTGLGPYWNDAVDWELSYNDATLPGRFYAKAETQWFSETTNAFTDIQGLVEGMKGIEPAAASPTNQMVRFEATIEIPEGAPDSLPEGQNIGDSRTGFAVAQLAGDAAPAYYAFDGSSWLKLAGAAPEANTSIDLLIVLDTAASTARYYVDGVALSTTNDTPAYVFSMKAGDPVIKGIGFSNPDGVVSPVVGEYDVPYAAAVGDTPFMVGAEGVAAADLTGTNTLYLLETGISGSVELGAGEILVVDFAKGDTNNLAVAAATGCTLGTVVSGNVVTYTASAAGDPEVVDPGDSLIAADFAGGIVPAGVVTETVTDPNSGEDVEVDFFVVNFRAPEAGVTYTLMTTTDLTLTEDQWKGIGEVGEVATKAAGDDAEKTSASPGDLITLKTPMTGNAAFFKIKASK